MWSLKKFIVSGLSEITKVEGMDKNQLIVFTSNSTIFGKLPTNGEISENFLSKFVADMANNYFEQNGVSEIPGDDGFLILEDATVLSNGRTIFSPSVVVFYDQIAGITIGDA